MRKWPRSRRLRPTRSISSILRRASSGVNPIETTFTSVGVSWKLWTARASRARASWSVLRRLDGPEGLGVQEREVVAGRDAARIARERLLVVLLGRAEVAVHEPDVSAVHEAPDVARRELRARRVLEDRAVVLAEGLVEAAEQEPDVDIVRRDVLAPPRGCRGRAGRSATPGGPRRRAGSATTRSRTRTRTGRAPGGTGRGGGPRPTRAIFCSSEAYPKTRTNRKSASQTTSRPRRSGSVRTTRTSAPAARPRRTPPVVSLRSCTRRAPCRTRRITSAAIAAAHTVPRARRTARTMRILRDSPSANVARRAPARPGRISPTCRVEIARPTRAQRGSGRSGSSRMAAA